MKDQQQAPLIELQSATDRNTRKDGLQLLNDRGQAKGIHGVQLYPRQPLA